MLSVLARKFGFWSLDWIRGGSVKRYHADIYRHVTDTALDNSILERRIKRLLKHATESTDFYRPFREFSTIRDFPIINKNSIKQNMNEIISKQYSNEKLHYMSTSGSTGTPLTVAQNRLKRQKVQAEVIYFNELCGFMLGERIAYLRAWTAKNKKNAIIARMQNMLMIDISSLDASNLESIRNVLKGDKKIKSVLGYATTLDVLSKYLRERKDNPKMFGVEVIISSSEVLSDTTKNNLKEIFGCHVVSRYSNQENGILAQQLVDSDFFILNNANYYFEFLKLDSEEKAGNGELSRVVVTDLFNDAFPMIRYDTGDLAVTMEHSKYGTVIKEIQGRRADIIYDTEGKILSPHSVTNRMWGLEDVKQYQLVQEDAKRYTLRLNVSKLTNKEDEIIFVLKSVLGEDAEISVDYVKEIPFHESGKFQTIICNYEGPN